MRRKKFSLIAAAATVACLATAGSALANFGAQLTTSKASPTTSITAGKAQAGGLFLDVTDCNPGDTACTGSNGTAGTQVTDGVNSVEVSWSAEVAIGKPKVPACNPASLAVAYQAALTACNGSMMGVGGATVCLGGLTVGTPCSNVQGDVVVFRGPDFTDPGLFGKAGKIYPQLLLYADIGVGQAIVPAVLIPASKQAKASGYKTTLHVFGSGPHESVPSQSITDFWANVNNGVKVKCGIAGQSGSTDIKYRGVWDTEFQSKKIDSTTQDCSYVP